jgi:hypothetical protein
MTMHFQRVGFYQPKGATPRRLAAAKKAIQREKDKWELFPENQTKVTPEERIARTDAGSIRVQKENRLKTARDWRIARASLRSLTEPLKGEVFRAWQTGMYPGTPAYLISLITGALRDPQMFCRQRRQLVYCRLIGEAQRRRSECLRLAEFFAAKRAALEAAAK